MDTSSLWRLSGGLKNLPMNLEAAAAPALPPWTLVGVAHFSPSGVLLQTSPRVCVFCSSERQAPNSGPSTDLLLWGGTANCHCDAVKKMASFL